jgi:hypothetical protein
LKRSYAPRILTTTSGTPWTLKSIISNGNKLTWVMVNPYILRRSSAGSLGKR